MTTILITGASGRVGAALLEFLPESLTIRAGLRSPESFKNKLAHVDYLPFDLEKPETFVPALADVSQVFLMWPPVKVDFVYDFIQAAEDAGVQHIVFLSIVVADKVDVLPHRRIEKRLELSTMRHTFLRASYFMQNLDTIHRAEIQELGEIFIPAGKGSLNFVDVRDVAEIAAQALLETHHENQTFALSGDETLSLQEVATIFSEVLGREIRYRDPFIPHFIWHMHKTRGYGLSLVLFMVVEYTLARFRFGTAIPSQISQILGRKARHLRQYVRDYQEAFE